MDLFPTQITEAIKTMNFKQLYELHFRNEKPITLNYGGKFYYLSVEGITDIEENAIICSKNLLDSIILKASNYSIYSINEDLKKGFITLSGGIRMGIVGEVVTENDCVKTVKNFNAINIRFPHEIKDCSLNAINYLIDNGQVMNTLIISSPCAGKTTFIRDLCYQISKINHSLNVLLLDERNEVSATNNGIPTNDVGNSTDIILYGNKKMGFENGIRSMSPNVIVTDEISNREDIESLFYASNCGISIIATTHSKDISDLQEKYLFNEVIRKKIFHRYIVLSQKNGAGTIDGIFDENLTRLIWNSCY